MKGTLEAASVRDRPDLRLVPSALAAWVAALGMAPLALHWPGVALALGTFAALAAVGLLGARDHVPTVLGAALACAAAVALGVVLRAEVTHTGVIVDLASDRAVATVDLVVSGDPRRLPPRTVGFGPARDQVIIASRLESVDARGHRWNTRVPVVVLASAEEWAGLLPSQHVRADVRLAPSRPGDSSAALLLARGPPFSVEPPSLLQRVAGVLRAGLRHAAAPLPADERGLLPGLVVGDTTALPPDVVDDFRTAGLTHLVAVSGANVAIVLAAALLAARWAGLRARMVSGAGLLAVLGFLVLARPDPSVLRATVCGVVAIVALSRGGRGAGVPALCAAIVVLLLIDPGLGRSYGFALSVLATAGLLVIAPGWRTRLARWMPQLLADALAVPAAAQLVCAPVIVMLSGTVSMVAIPANLLVAPAVAPATVLGVLMALLAPLSVNLAQLLAYLAWIPVAWIVAVARISAQLPGATVSWPEGKAGGLLLVALVLVGWLAGPALIRRRGLAAGLAALLLLVLSPLGPRTPWPPVDTRAVFCDVGQGDAIVVPTSPGHALLVDAGPDPDAVDRCLSDLGIRALDAVVLSHLHADHVEGLPGAFRGRTVGEVVVGPLDEPPEQAEEVRGWITAAGVPWRRAVVGEQRQVGDVRWQVVWPVRVIRGEGSDPNNASIVLVVDTGGVRLLLTGDVEAAAQKVLLPLIAGLDPPLDVLKVPHHGSRSQDPELVATVRPRLAVVSVGAGNTYGHPAPETLAAYSALGVPVLRTDLSGEVAVVGSGTDLRLVPRR